MPLSEMFGTFALSVGAAVSSFLIISSYWENLDSELNFKGWSFVAISCAELNWVVLMFRWVWSFGQGGLIKLSGTLLCGTCMRYISHISVDFVFHKSLKKRILDFLLLFAVPP